MEHPVALLVRASMLWIERRVRFVRDLRGVGFEDRGEAFVPFRKVVVVPASGQLIRPPVIFRVRFRFKNLSAGANRVLSLIPVPLILAQPGFRSKTWLFGRRTGDFIGHYEFDTLEAADGYWQSLPLRMMRRRATAGSLTHEIFEQKSHAAH